MGNSGIAVKSLMFSYQNIEPGVIKLSTDSYVLCIEILNSDCIYKWNFLFN